MQIAIRLSESELESLDRLVSDGHHESRAAAMRAALDMLVRAEREERIRRSYEEAYAKQPLTPDEEQMLDAAERIAGEALLADEA